MTLKGKGFFIWKIKNCESGNANKIAIEAKAAGLSHVLIKIANGIYTYNYDWDKKIDLVPPVAQAMRNMGIQVWGWHYVYGDNPVSEARIAIKRVQELGLDGYVIDAESQYKQSGKKTAAKQFMRELKGGLGNSAPIALSSYRYPSLHPIPWDEFLEKCDYNMPQVYWIHSHNPGAQLAQTLREFDSPKIKYHPPIIPVGAAFREHGWESTAHESVEFLETARALNLSAANFWSWYSCREQLTPKLESWNAIANYNWESGSTPQDITAIYIDALNTHDVEKVASLYSDRAVHVTSAGTILGKAAIRGWYSTFLNQVLPNATFALTGFSGTGNSRHFTWTAQSAHRQVTNGNDTFGLSDDKITYHYSSFAVS
ncbi:MAG: nuclear transport factor 2 family protein [Chloroflexi bacterium]|nr:nuclear transport factor 2 family protein [Chloroflexota bacterium]